MTIEEVIEFLMENYSNGFVLGYADKDQKRSRVISSGEGRNLAHIVTMAQMQLYDTVKYEMIESSTTVRRIENGSL